VPTIRTDYHPRKSAAFFFEALVRCMQYCTRGLDHQFQQSVLRPSSKTSHPNQVSRSFGFFPLGLLCLLLSDLRQEVRILQIPISKIRSSLRLVKGPFCGTLSSSLQRGSRSKCDVLRGVWGCNLPIAHRHLDDSSRDSTMWLLPDDSNAPSET